MCGSVTECVENKWLEFVYLRGHCDFWMTPMSEYITSKLQIVVRVDTTIVRILIATHFWMCLPNIMSRKWVGDRYCVTICDRPRHSKCVPVHSFRPPFFYLLRPIPVIAYWCKDRIHRFPFIGLQKPIHFGSITWWDWLVSIQHLCFFVWLPHFFAHIESNIWT